MESAGIGTGEDVEAIVKRIVLWGVFSAVLAFLLSPVLGYLRDEMGRDVPDVPAPPLVEQTTPEWTPPAQPDQLNEDPADVPARATSTVPPAQGAVSPGASSDGQMTDVPDYRPPAQPGPVDYRQGRILEPYPADDPESQRQRAYARCIYAQEDDPAQRAFCDEHYGPAAGAR